MGDVTARLVEDEPEQQVAKECCYVGASFCSPAFMASDPYDLATTRLLATLNRMRVARQARPGRVPSRLPPELHAPHQHVNAAAVAHASKLDGDPDQSLKREIQAPDLTDTAKLGLTFHFMGILLSSEQSSQKGPQPWIT